MNAPLRGVVVGHDGLAAALVDAVAQIAGDDTGLVAVSNRDCSRGELESRVVAAVGGQPTVVFVDMPTGSCSVAVMRRMGETPGVAVVTGVNLAMLLEFVFHRDAAPLEAAQRAVAAGLRAVAAHG